MKKTMKLFVACLVAAMSAMPLFGAQDILNIPIIRTNPPGENVTRNPVESPFFAEYNDVFNCIVLGCSSACGEVSVTVYSTAGDSYETEFDTLDGAIILPVSGESGHYVLTIVTSGGQVYAGEFDL